MYVNKYDRRNSASIGNKAERIFTYLAGLFRKRDIRLHGTPDVHGVIKAKWESHLGTVQVLLDWFVFGFIVKHMVELDSKVFDTQPYYTYWILIDCILMFLLQAYNYIVQFMRVRSASIKNVYSLCFVQHTKLQSKKEYFLKKLKKVF